jgi:hypothetical protein
MMDARYNISAQSGAWGYFADVHVLVAADPGASGSQLQGAGTRVLVLEFRGHIVDTTEVVAAFAAAHAFFKALGATPPNGFQLDAATGLFTFPK